MKYNISKGENQAYGKKLEKILEKHVKWLNNEPDGGRANLSGADLSGTNLICAHLSGANLGGADLIGADLNGADLIGANLNRADLNEANISWANLSEADLRAANLNGADLSWAHLNEADLSGADLRGASLSWADLSQSVGLLSPVKFISENFESTSEGILAYKVFNGVHKAPQSWQIAEGSVIEESVNPNRSELCGCGINVAPLNWVKPNYDGDIWKVLIKWEWLAGVVVPYNTTGQIRCEKVQLIETIGG